MNNTQKLKAALVCADSKTRQTISEFLGLFNYEVVKNTQYGFDCASEMLQSKPQVVICDAFVYDLDACGLYEEIKSLGLDTDVVFVVATFVFDSSLINKVLNCGIDLFTLLPTDFYTLDKNIRKLVQDKSNGMTTKTSYDDEKFAIRTKTTSLIHNLGHSSGVLGYDYVIEGVCIVASNKSDTKLEMTKDVYPEIARKFNTSPAAVERAIRSAIDKSWLLGNVDLINDIFGYSVDANKGRPSNAPYINTIAERIKTELKLK